jgi:hypothetical protein
MRDRLPTSSPKAEAAAVLSLAGAALRASWAIAARGSSAALAGQPEPQ